MSANRIIRPLGRLIASKNSSFLRQSCLASRQLSKQPDYESNSIHFRATNTPHPLATEGNSLKAVPPTPTISGLDKDGNPIAEVKRCSRRTRLKNSLPNLTDIMHLSHLSQPYGNVLGDHTGLLQNHIWKEEELKEKLTTLYHHKPQTMVDHVTQKVVRIISLKARSTYISHKIIYIVNVMISRCTPCTTRSTSSLVTLQ
jgi:hypothetical protein